MITRDDMVALSGWEYWTETHQPIPPELYSSFVEDMIITQGQERLMENTLGLVGEAGEVAEKVKKAVRKDGVLDHESLIKELGDVLFYTAALANYLGYDLTTVMERNVQKLSKRKAENKIRGDGDDR